MRVSTSLDVTPTPESTASRKCWRIMILLTVVIAPGKLVQTWKGDLRGHGKRNCCFQSFLGLSQMAKERSRSKRCAIVKRQGISPQSPWAES